MKNYVSALRLPCPLALRRPRSLQRLLLLTSLAVGAATATATAATAAEPAPEEIRYVFVNDNLGTPGQQVVTRAADGTTTVRFVYKNNGRGPELTERYRLADDGTFSEYHLTGSATLGGPVDEHFERRGDTATWRSTSESGRTTVAGSAYYLPISGSLAPVSVAIAALARRADGALPMLPGGTLRHRRVDEVEVRRDGQSQRVRLIAQTGVGLQPWFFWATSGDAPRLFAVADLNGEIFIEDGWQANRALLEAAQAAAENTLQREMAARLLHPMPGLTVVRNARIFDSASARVGEASDVYLLRGRISAVLPAGSVPREPAREIDAAGRVLLPGLYDMHGHVGRWDGVLNLAAGVTTVRDMGNGNLALQRLIDDGEAGTLLTPRIVPCGFLEGRSPYSSSFGFTVSTLDEAREAIDWYAQRGYPQLKIYNSFPKEILRETVAYAHRRGMRVSGHVPAFLRAQDVIDAGFDEIQHINQVLLNFLVTPTTDTRTLERFTLPAEKVADLDFDARPVQDFIALLRERRTVIDPTVATFAFIQQRDGEMSLPYAAVADHMPPDVTRNFRTSGMKIVDDATAARYRRSYAKMVDFIGRMHLADVTLVAGTDAWAGITLPGELALYVQAGLTPAEALQVATRNAAQVSRSDAERGRIEPGKLADLLLVDGDPTVDIAAVRRVALVVTRGSWLSPKAVHEELGIVPFVTAMPEIRELAAAAASGGSVRQQSQNGQQQHQHRH